MLDRFKHRKFIPESSEELAKRVRLNPCIPPANRIVYKPALDLSEGSYFIPYGNDDGNEEDERVCHTEVMDQDECMLENEYFHHALGQILDGLPFKLFILAVILLNSFVIGLQSFPYLEENYGVYFHALDRLFLIIFIMELLFKLYYDFWMFWLEGWNIFDFVIISFTVLGNNFYNLTNARIFKILKVIRALRSLRSISAFQGLQIVIHTIWNSIPDMANIVALLLIFMLIFSIIGVSIFGEVSPRDFGNLWRAWFTLYVCLTQDGWVEVFRRLEAQNYYEVGAIYFATFIVIGAFVLMNLVVAVVITVLERALEEEKELDAIEKLSKAKADNLVDLKAVDGYEKLKEINFNQKPIEIPDFKFNEEELSLYFVTLSALEDNFREFKKIKTELQTILHNQKLINKLVQIPVESYSPEPDITSTSCENLHSAESIDDMPQLEDTQRATKNSASFKRRFSVGIQNFKNIVLPPSLTPDPLPGSLSHSMLTTDVVSNLMRISSAAHIDVEGANGIGDLFTRMRDWRYSLS